jgi:protein-L-isoaspartate(D-aspartate) O-methyltransferase
MSGLLHERGQSRLVETLGDLGINDVFVLDAFRRVPRHFFVDPAVADSAYADVTLPLGFQQTLSQPSVVARMLELVRGSHDLLDFKLRYWRTWRCRYLQLSGLHL